MTTALARYSMSAVYVEATALQKARAIAQATPSTNAVSAAATASLKALAIARVRCRKLVTIVRATASMTRTATAFAMNLKQRAAQTQTPRTTTPQRQMKTALACTRRHLTSTCRAWNSRSAPFTLPAHSAAGAVLKGGTTSPTPMPMAFMASPLTCPLATSSISTWSTIGLDKRI